MVEQLDPTAFLTGLATKVKNIEEKQNMLKEKSLLLGQSFLKQEETLREDVASLKDEIKEMSLDIERIKDNVENIIQETENFSRREELKVIEKSMKIWDPLKFVREDEVKKMIDEALEKAQNPPKKHGKSYIN
ncbi:hypothetical protein ACFLZZ_02070 [Nanoarchaeota archaeon]